MPFAVVFMELFFILKSMWQDQYYYMFGFLATVGLLLAITCIEVTIVVIYFHLCNENYHWQWRSFAIASSSGWYILFFGIFYFVSHVEYCKNLNVVVNSFMFSRNKNKCCLLFHLFDDWGFILYAMSGNIGILCNLSLSTHDL